MTHAALYSRHEHGGHPVRVVTDAEHTARYEVDWPQGTESYPSARSLLRAIYSGGDGSLCARDPGISFRRYFKTDAPVPTGGFADLFLDGTEAAPRPSPPRRGRVRSRRSRLTVAKREGLRRRAKLVVEAPWWDEPVVVATRSRSLPVGSWCRGLTVAKPKRRARPRKAKLTVEIKAEKSLVRTESVKLGIDLEARGHEVRKILYACFGQRIGRLGFDPEEVLQEVYRGLLARNNGKCPWDVRKSSFGHYVHMVTECILRNYARKQRRISKHEQVGVFTATDDEWGMVDAALVAADSPDDWGRVEEPTAAGMVEADLEDWLMESDRPEAVLAVLALPHVSAGCTRAMVAERVGDEIGEPVTPNEMGKALAYLRRETRAWADHEGLR
jgi:hypothetical protein